MSSAVIVGAGTFGASLAWRLSREGFAVTLVDQFEPGDVRATSGGESRLYRCCHGADEMYTRSARRARELWRELEAETGEDLLVETGVVWFAHREGGWETQSEQVLRECGIPVERVDPAELFPSFAGGDLAFSLFEPEAGAVRAAKAVRALVSASRAQVVRGRATPDGGGVAVGGETLRADVVVWACGAWLRDLFGIKLRVTGQEVFLFDNGPGWESVPGWVDYDGAAYGTGDIDGLGFKACPDVEGPPLEPDAPLPGLSEKGEMAARAYVSRRFPELTDVPLRGGRACRYELSPDSHHIAAQHDSGVWIVGGGSGHGFKHGPAMAERVVGAIVRGEPVPERFGLHERVPGRSLRTAGTIDE